MPEISGAEVFSGPKHSIPSNTSELNSKDISIATNYSNHLPHHVQRSGPADRGGTGRIGIGVLEHDVVFCPNVGVEFIICPYRLDTSAAKSGMRVEQSVRRTTLRIAGPPLRADPVMQWNGGEVTFADFTERTLRSPRR
jgi:hypothetical protein